MTSKIQPTSYLIAVKLIGFAASLSACGVATHAGDGLVLSGSPEAIRAFWDGQNALITNGKASADIQDTPAYNLRREQVRASVLRYNQPRAEGK